MLFELEYLSGDKSEGTLGMRRPLGEHRPLWGAAGLREWVPKLSFTFTRCAGVRAREKFLDLFCRAVLKGRPWCVNQFSFFNFRGSPEEFKTIVDAIGNLPPERLVWLRRMDFRLRKTKAFESLEVRSSVLGLPQKCRDALQDSRLRESMGTHTDTFNNVEVLFPSGPDTFEHVKDLQAFVSTIHVRMGPSCLLLGWRLSPCPYGFALPENLSQAFLFAVCQYRCLCIWTSKYLLLHCVCNAV